MKDLHQDLRVAIFNNFFDGQNLMQIQKSSAELLSMITKAVNSPGYFKPKVDNDG